MPIYPFVKKPKGNPEDCGLSFTLHQKLEAGERLTEDETFILMNNTMGGSVPKGCIARAGWCFDLRHLLNLYWVRWYDDIIPVYAPNKRAIRKHTLGKVGRIVLVEKQGIRAHR